MVKSALRDIHFQKKTLPQVMIFLPKIGTCIKTIQPLYAREIRHPSTNAYRMLLKSQNFSICLRGISHFTKC